MRHITLHVDFQVKQLVRRQIVKVEQTIHKDMTITKTFHVETDETFPVAMMSQAEIDALLIAIRGGGDGIKG